MEGRPIRFEPAITCRPGEIIREMQNQFIESGAGFIVLSDGPDGTRSRGGHAARRFAGAGRHERAGKRQ